MEETTEKQIWQRVRGAVGTEPEEALRRWLAEQGKLWAAYRSLSRRGGRYRLLFEQKDRQLSCLRGLLRLRTGQAAARPRCGEAPPDLMACYGPEARFLEELTRNSREPDPALAALAEGQKKQLCLLLELLGSP